MFPSEYSKGAIALIQAGRQEAARARTLPRCAAKERGRMSSEIFHAGENERSGEKQAIATNRQQEFNARPEID